jgi:hypothetical protein
MALRHFRLTASFVSSLHSPRLCLASRYLSSMKILKDMIQVLAFVISRDIPAIGFMLPTIRRWVLELSGFPQCPKHWIITLNMRPFGLWFMVFVYANSIPRVMPYIEKEIIYCRHQKHPQLKILLPPNSRNGSGKRKGKGNTPYYPWIEVA